MNDGIRKSNHNLFQRFGKKLEKNFGFSSSNLFHNHSSSLHNLSLDKSQNSTKSDLISLQNYPQTNSESPNEILRQKYNYSNILANQFIEQYPSNDIQLYNSSTKYDQEMQIICNDLLKDKNKKLYDIFDYGKKISLLHVALSYNQPKVIVPVLLYLENSLSKQIFYNLIKQYPTAIDYYINLVKLHPNNDHYLSVLKQFGKNEDIAMIHIREANKSNSLTNKITLLDQAAIELSSNPWWHSQVIEYRHLLEKQREIQTYLLSLRADIPLEHRTLLKTYKIVYGIYFQQQKYRRQIDEIIVQRINELETEFSMAPEMIICGKLAVIMKCRFQMHYGDFLQQTTYQGFFGKKYILEPENFADMVYNWIKLNGEGQEKASEEAGKFVCIISNPMRRLFYAEKYQNYDIAIDTIVNVLRNRIQLENLLKHIPREHSSFNRAAYLLENTKWRN